MSTRLNRAAYQRLIDQDIVWLEKQPRTLERDHIRMILQHAVKYEYGPEYAPVAASPSGEAPPAQVTRFEVIDHRSFGGGRTYTAIPCRVELSYQDDGRTLKVFVNDAPVGGEAPPTTHALCRDAKQAAREHVAKMVGREAPSPATPTNQPCWALSRRLGCTLPIGHAGDHIAEGIGGRELERWPLSTSPAGPGPGGGAD